MTTHAFRRRLPARQYLWLRLLRARLAGRVCKDCGRREADWSPGSILCRSVNRNDLPLGDYPADVFARATCRWWQSKSAHEATLAMAAWLRRVATEKQEGQGDADGGFLVPEAFITDMYEGAADYSARLTQSRWNILRRWLGRTCESCRWHRQLKVDPACRCAWNVLGDGPLWGKAFYPSAKASCRRWKRRGDQG